ncbi:ribulose-5-phosphate 4-epimerase related epimerase / aldolase [Klebsiella pneumoniae]|uniref:Ribulose-5-phosphate 4-epimerase related epimerase / aldolase n=1 Tax=Klebsiella pneumoniae TaxID=573 RepID=A0A2X3F3I4_KLEPN|nr:ribulose-5-phosphate 4-epimerase related epimerase / aldolase [Klebsiella pneumoniae]
MATEQHLRQQLAAAYRLAALFGWEDTLYTHFSVRLPGDGEPRFLINPFGMMFDEVTASNLIVVDMQGKVVAGDAPANSAGFTIHSAVAYGPGRRPLRDPHPYAAGNGGGRLRGWPAAA